MGIVHENPWLGSMDEARPNCLREIRRKPGKAFDFRAE